MKKGTYKEVEYQPVQFIQINMGSDSEDGMIEDACFVCCLSVMLSTLSKE